MGILNANYDFWRQASHGTHAAFSRPPKKTLFAVGHELRRFVTAGEHQVFGRWWFTKDVLRKLVNKADPRFLGIADLARIDLAITKEFNARMDWMCAIRLTQQVYGWVGPAARQLASDRSNIYLGGGADQVLLPNLATAPGTNASQHADIVFFGMCFDVF